MSAILKMFIDRQTNHPSRWLILDCGHWYHWTGTEAPKAEGDFPCPDCKGPIVVQMGTATEEPTT